MRIIVLLQKASNVFSFTPLLVWDHQGSVLCFRDRCEVFNGVHPTLSEETQKQTLCTCNKRQIQQTKMFGPEQVRSIGGCIVMPTKSVFITGLGMKNCWIIARRSRVFNSPSVSWLKLVVVLSLLLVCPVSCAIFPAVVAEAGQQFQCLLLREWRLCLETGQRRTGNEPRLQYEGNPPKWTQ